jgi:hypothetical protein
LRLGAGSRKTQRPHNKSFLKKENKFFKERVRPLSRLQQAKKSLERREAKLLTRSASKQNLWGGRGAGTPAPLCQEQKNLLYF